MIILLTKALPQQNSCGSCPITRINRNLLKELSIECIPSNRIKFSRKKFGFDVYNEPFNFFGYKKQNFDIMIWLLQTKVTT